MDSLQLLSDPSAGVWLKRRLLSWETSWARVGSVVPTGFPRVVRVLHPAEDGRSTWAQIAARQGRTVHALTQWSSIAPADYDGNGRSERDPTEGSVPESTLRAILSHCPSQGDIVHAVWSGWGSWTRVPPTSALMTSEGGRDYALFRGTKAPHLSWPGMDPFWSQSASLIWPTDQAWCIATEIDWDSTLVAGPDHVADALLADDSLEAFEVNYDDELSHGPTGA